MNKSVILMIFVMTSIIEVQVKAATEAVIIEVRKNLPLSKQDKSYRQYFINGGTAMGLQKGSTVEVLRRLPVHDPLKNASVGDLKVKVGELEIIHADGRLSVARELSMETPEQRPLLDYEAFMVGDRLDLGSIKAGAAVKNAGLSSQDPQSKEIALLDKKTSAKDLVAEGKRHLASLESNAPAKAPAPLAAKASAKAKKAKSPGRTIRAGKPATQVVKSQASLRAPASISQVSKKK
ncbi:MAG: hypothetical protein K2Q26_04355 [Bdellovibrionales bacterium]|nr:hypothetical protein [Bdellovibrionales bacterium]